MPNFETCLFETLYISIGEEATLSRIPILKHIPDTEGATHCMPGYLPKEQVTPWQCPNQSSSPSPNFYNSKHNFNSITCGSNEPSQRQHLYLSFSCPRHPSQSVPGTSQALKGYQTEPNQFSLPLCHVGSKVETCSFPSSQFFMQMAGVWPLTHFGPHDSSIIHSLPSHLPTLLPVESRSTNSPKAVGIKKQRHHFANKDLSSQSYSFSSSHVQMWGLNHKEDWRPKDWCFQTVMLEKTPESPLGSMEIKSLNPKGNRPWLFIGRTDAEAEAPIRWPPDAKSWHIRKDPDAGKDGRQEEKGMTEDEMVKWHHWYNGHEFKQALGDGEGQASLACCNPWGCKVGHDWATEQQQQPRYFSRCNASVPPWGRAMSFALSPILTLWEGKCAPDS